MPASMSFCPSAVAPPWLPMAGNEKGLAARLADLGGDGLQDERQAGDAAAAGGDGDPVARLHPGERPAGAQLLDQLAGDIGHLRPLEALPDLDQARDGDGV